MVWEWTMCCRLSTACCIVNANDPFTRLLGDGIAVRFLYAVVPDRLLIAVVVHLLNSFRAFCTVCSHRAIQCLHRRCVRSMFWRLCHVYTRSQPLLG